MYISDLSVHDFRSYTEAVIALGPGVNAFVGANGQGKTNVVEAVEYLATASSHRVASDGALIRRGAGAAVVRARVRESQVRDLEAREIGDGEGARLDGETAASSGSAARSTLIEVEIIAGRANRARINRGEVKPAQALGIVRAVVFAPEDLALVTGDPGTRRKFLDSLMVQRRPRMAGVKADFEKVIRQRAALLKTASKIRRRGGVFDESSLSVWDAQLARFGAQIVAARAEIIRELRPFVADYYRSVSGDEEPARIDYEANLDSHAEWELPNLDQLTVGAHGAAEYGEIVDAHELELMDASAVEHRFLEVLEEIRPREIEAGINLIGPQRDDVRLGLGVFPARGFASHGESWSYALALRLASWQVLRSEDAWGSEPILILDDVFAELDEQRRSRLTSLIVQAEQVLITAAVGDDLPENLDARVFDVRESVITPRAEANQGESGGSVGETEVGAVTPEIGSDDE